MDSPYYYEDEEEDERIRMKMFKEDAYGGYRGYDGRWIVRTHETGTFTTTSDKQLTDFFFKFAKCGVPFQVFDFVFKLFRDEEFVAHFRDDYFKIPKGFGDAIVDLLCKRNFVPRDISVQTPEDIVDRMYERERKAKEDDETLRLSLSAGPVGTIPLVVVELVADQLTHSAWDQFEVPGQLELFDSYGYRQYLARDTLQTMSLVHPSWSYIAQRRLRRSHWVPIHSLKALRNPDIGPWVQQLGLQWETFGGGMDDINRFLCKFNQRCPNVKVLKLHLYIWSGSVRSVVQQIGYMTSLECLQLHSIQDNGSCALWDLFLVLPGLPFLKKLELISWQEGDPEYHPLANTRRIELNRRQGVVPDLSGKYLDLTLEEAYVVDYQPLIWLTRAYGDHALKLSLLSCHCYQCNTHSSLSCLRPIWHHITNLQIKYGGSEDDDALTVFCQEMHNLRTLDISIVGLKLLWHSTDLRDDQSLTLPRADDDDILNILELKSYKQGREPDYLNKARDMVHCLQPLFHRLSELRVVSSGSLYNRDLRDLFRWQDMPNLQTFTIKMDKFVPLQFQLPETVQLIRFRNYLPYLGVHWPDEDSCPWDNLSIFLQYSPGVQRMLMTTHPSTETFLHSPEFISTYSILREYCEEQNVTLHDVSFEGEEGERTAPNLCRPPQDWRSYTTDCSDDHVHEEE